MHAVAERFGLDDRWALLACRHRTRRPGSPTSELRAVARDADVLINISGILTDEDLVSAGAAYVSTSTSTPPSTSSGTRQGIDMRFGGHTHFVTVGQAIGTPACPVPTCGLDWIPTVPPVVLEHWPRARADAGAGAGAFTTVGNWRGYGSVEHEGSHYGQKAHSMRELMAHPDAHRRGRCARPSTSIPARRPTSRRSTATAGSCSTPRPSPHDPDSYRAFIAGSRAELGVAKSGYVLSRCGWFSDRSACYLASGRPVLAQDTGFAGLPADGRGAARVRRRGRRGRRHRGDPRATTSATPTPRARWPRSTSTPTGC